jgi:hypothetical protein
VFVLIYLRTANISLKVLFFSLLESAEEDELEEAGSVSLTSPEPPSTAPRKGSKGSKMSDNYDVENQGRPEPPPTVTTSLTEKPEIDKKVKVSLANCTYLVS